MSYKKIFYLRLIPIILGLFLMVFAMISIQIKSKFGRDFIHGLDYLVYGLRYKHASMPPAERDIIKIVAIDGKSVNREGAWPWSRDKIALLLKKLQANGAQVVVFDMIFTAPEENMARMIQQKLARQRINNAQFDQIIANIIPYFNYDQMLAKQFNQKNIILGYLFFAQPGKSMGQLPSPIYILKASQSALGIPRMQGYIANIPVLQNTAQYGGFLTILPDTDGILRRAPLLLRYGDNLYPSLALEAVRLYLAISQLDLIVHEIDGMPLLTGIKFGTYSIPTDQRSQIFIPYINPQHNFENLSATDILNATAPIPQLKNSLVFIGVTALHLANLKTTVTNSMQTSVEIHASIAAELLNHNIHYIPAWAKGAEFLTLLIIGLLLIFSLPFMGIVPQVILTLLVAAGLVGINLWLWQVENISLPFAQPLLLTLILGGINISYGFFVENYRRRQLKKIFDQYVPAAHIEKMLKHSELNDLLGETKEMTVLFADIRNFTDFSEDMDVVDLKNLLNSLFTELTGVILKNNGTIDKYIGDMVMAFWGAPLPDSNHAKDALRAAFQMHIACQKLQPIFSQQGLPVIKIGIGINSGLMNVGDMGSKFRRNYTVLGDAVNTGSRVEALTKYYHVDTIITEFTASGQDNIVFRYLDKIRVKGKEHPIIIYQPVAYRNDLESTTLARLMEELAQLKQAILYYDTQQWDKSIEIFRELQTQYPQVYLYSIYLKRLAFLKKHPPHTWDGVYQFIKKI